MFNIAQLKFSFAIQDIAAAQQAVESAGAKIQADVDNRYKDERDLEWACQAFASHAAEAVQLWWTLRFVLLHKCCFLTPLNPVASATHCCSNTQTATATAPTLALNVLLATPPGGCAQSTILLALIWVMKLSAVFRICYQRCLLLQAAFSYLLFPFPDFSH